MKGSWAIIANPVSGRGRGKRNASRLSQILNRSGAKIKVLWTTGPGEAEWLATKAVKDGTDGLLVCGGDGTLHEVINGLLSSSKDPDQVPIGVVPSGRCNDFASCLKLPKELSTIVGTLAFGHVRKVDLGLIGERYYSTVATFGFDSSVSEYVADGRCPSFLAGTSAYLYGAFMQLIRYSDVNVKISGDSITFEGPVFLAATGNTPTYGGRMQVAPSAVVDDGLLDLCLVKSVSRLEVVRMMPHIFNGGHVHHPAVSLHRVKRLTIEPEKPLWLWADGEKIAKTPATIEVVPKALSVLTPTQHQG